MRNTTLKIEWPAILIDPSGQRAAKPRSKGRTMVLDKGFRGGEGIRKRGRPV